MESSPPELKIKSSLVKLLYLIINDELKIINKINTAVIERYTLSCIV